MSYCINPKCLERQNPDNLEHCQACGTQLLIQQRYRLVKPLRKLDEQRDTEIFEVDDRGTPKVLKILKNRKWVHLFDREARTLQRLESLGIPTVESDGYFSFAPKNGPKELYCLVMEKIEGQTLEQWLLSHGTIDGTLALKWLRQLFEILDLVHQNELFHRDIKLSNIMLRTNGQLVLIDFGTVREVTDTYLAKISGRRDITGIVSPGYTPLEQVNGKAVPQSDFYALGRTFVYLLTGKHPIEFAENPQTGELIWRDSAPSVSKSLADLLDYFMAPFPGRRPQNTQVILQCLAEIEEELQRPQAKRRWRFKSLVYLFLSVLTIGLVLLGHSLFVTPTIAKQPCLVSKAQHLVSLQHEDDVNAIAFSPDSKYLATASLDNSARIWEWKLKEKESGTCEILRPQHRDNVVAVAYSPKGKYLATASLDSTVQLHVVATKYMTLLQHSAGVVDVTFSPDEKYLATASADGTARVWDTSTGKEVGRPRQHNAFVTAVTFSPDNKYLATASLDKTAKVWEVKSDKPVTPDLKHGDSVVAVAFSPDSKYLATASSDNTARVWETISGRAVMSPLKHDDGVVAVTFSPDSKYLATASTDHWARVWEMTSVSANAHLKYSLQHSDAVSAVAFSPDGKYLATASWDNTARVWKALTGQPFWPPLQHAGGVVAVAFSPDGKSLATASWDKMARVWEFNTASP
ncbi:MAG: protein kinase [Rhizonema sp. PD38]|nr:protein kinase [Rhizonema sp. PD38]